jgi:hypothetical protein
MGHQYAIAMMRRKKVGAAVPLHFVRQCPKKTLGNLREFCNSLSMKADQDRAHAAHTYRGTKGALSILVQCINLSLHNASYQPIANTKEHLVWNPLSGHARQRSQEKKY